MRDEQTGMMLVRAELSERLEELHDLSRRYRARDFAGSVRALRSLASAYGLYPVARLAEALERAIAEDWLQRSTTCPTRLYLDRLQDAIGCGRVDDQASEALLASVSVRLSA